MGAFRVKAVVRSRYFGVIGNSLRLWQLLHHVRRLAFKWWNRRSQRRSFTWAEFAEAWERWKMPRPKIVETPLPWSWREARQAGRA
ncbi:hypothetical protein Hsar01_04084 [Haloferula sargassicola]|uniref:Group II intron maturase-specific domain-containing protein n=1 Tax=Haloferula sargassicola TaxID=490096 RepID=A0ABP9UZL6_9BACT